MLRTPDIAELRTFCTAADMGSLGAAARRLHVSQPAVSRRLAALEALAGVELLERTSRGVELTHAGRRVYAEAHRLLEQAETVAGVLATLGERAGAVRVAASPTPAETLLAQALGEDHLAVELLVANSATVRSLVRAGHVDFGVAARLPGAEADPRLREEAIAVDEVVCAVPLAHRWSRARRVGLQEFLAEPMVIRDPGACSREVVDHVLDELGAMCVAPLCEVGSTAAAKRKAHELGAPVLLSERVVGIEDGLEIVTVEGVRFLRDLCLVFATGDVARPEVELLAGRLRAVASGA